MAECYNGAFSSEEMWVSTLVLHSQGWLLISHWYNTPGKYQESNSGELCHLRQCHKNELLWLFWTVLQFGKFVVSRLNRQIKLEPLSSRAEQSQKRPTSWNGHHHHQPHIRTLHPVAMGESRPLLPSSGKWNTVTKEQTETSSNQTWNTRGPQVAEKVWWQDVSRFPNGNSCWHIAGQQNYTIIFKTASFIGHHSFAETWCCFWQ